MRLRNPSLIERMKERGFTDPGLLSLLAVGGGGGGGGGMGGITQLTGPVTAGPGTGSQPTTITPGTDSEVLTTVAGVATWAAQPAFDLMVPAANADVALTNVARNTTLYFSGLTATHTATLPAVPSDGQRITVKDQDGSLATQDFIADGNGNDIDGAATYTMTNMKNGPKASISMRYSAALTAWLIV
jgi:hypothetical protein